MFACSECKREFGYKKNLYHHLRKVHGQEDPVPRKHKSNILCNICGKTFRTKCNLKRHEKVIHNVDDSSKNETCIKCTECSWHNARTYHILRKHLLEKHNIETPFEEFHFSSFKEFETWKSLYESKNAVSYVMHSGSNKLANDVVKTYYYCHRSNTYKSRGQNIRSLKNMGSHKIGAGCPSTTELTVDASGTHFVKLWPVHLGHSTEIARCNLTKIERATIAGKLLEGVPMQQVIDDVRTSITEGDKIKRIHLLKKKDLHNIKREFSINIDTKFHENDAISVDSWATRMKATNHITETSFSCFDKCVAQSSNVNEITDNEIREKCELLLGLSTRSDLGSHSKRVLVKYLDKAIDILSNEKVKFKSKEKVHTKENMQKQIRFFSRRKEES